MSSAGQLLAVTPGEPAGIGPEIVARLLFEHPGLPLVAVADPELMAAAAARLGLRLPVREWLPGQPLPAEAMAVYPVTLKAASTPGRPDPANASYVLETLDRAVGLVQQGHAGALVTGPVHKGIINDAGIPFTGHTEYLARLGGVEQVVMMLAAPGLRVCLVTTHLPLREVPAALNPETLERVIRVSHDSLRSSFGIAQPRLQVLGLNPHAGEGGHLGHEEDAIMAPVLERLRSEGMVLEGPVPADTAFNPLRLARCDAVVAMYHDQGLPVLKHMGFGRSVNITLGLPFVRTSVDHGTALDLAGSGTADTGSLAEAVSTAQRMIQA
jgi:4-hydroxythreonine-4-phosphate dehydrogenase